MSRRKQLLILALGLAFVVPLAAAFLVGYQESLEREQRNWYWDYKLESSQLNKHFPDPINYTRPTMSNDDRSFWYYWQPSYSQTLKSYDGGPITIKGGDSPFSSPSTGEIVNAFTFGDLGTLLYDNLSWFITDWRPLQWLESNFGISQNAVAIHAGNHFAVFSDADCTSTTVATDADCWATTSGGTDAGLPGAGDNLLFDSGDLTSGTLGGNLDVTTGTIDFCSGAGVPDAACAGAYTGTLTIIGGFLLTNTGTFNFNGGTLSISNLDTGIDTGPFTFNGGSITSGSGVIRLSHDGLTITSGLYSRFSGTLTVTGNLTMDGGDLNGLTGLVFVSGNVNISSASSAIDFDGEVWTVSGTWTNASTDTFWDAGTGTMNFDSATGGTMTFGGTNLGEREFDDITFESSAGTPQIFTMATRSIDFLGTLTVSDSSSTTELDTANLDIGPSGSLTIASGGILTARDSTVTITAVTVGSTGFITSTGSGSWSVTGTFWTNNSTNSSWSFAAPISFDSPSPTTIGGSGTQNIFTGAITLSTGGDFRKSFTGNITTVAVSITAATTVTITDTITWTITGGSIVSGTSGAVLTLVSSTPGTQWDWAVSDAGNITITFADITDANATAVPDATTARFDATATSNTDSENNTYVEFNGSPVTEYINARWYEDADSYYWAGAINGLTSLTQWDVATTLGYFGTTVTVFNATGPTTVTVCSSDGTTSLTLTVGGLTADTSYELERDAVETGSASTGSGGVWTLLVIGGWDTDCSTNSLVLAPAGGGGGTTTTGTDGETDFEWEYDGDRCSETTRTLKYTDTTVSEKSVLLYIWDFGDGTPTVVNRSPTVEHFYADVGTYTVEHAVTFTDGSIFRSSAQVEVGFCSVSFLTEFAPNIAIAIIALSGVLWTSFVLTRRARHLVYALAATGAGVGTWAFAGFAGVATIVTGITTVVVALAAILWAAFFMMRRPRLLVYALIATMAAIMAFILS